MRGAATTCSGNQDRRHPGGPAKRKGKGKRGKKGPVRKGPLHDAMVNAAL